MDPSEQAARRLTLANGSLARTKQELYEAIGPITKMKFEEEQKAKEASEPQKSDDNVVDAEVKQST